jgi:xanthine dehydrogenase large subunit
MLAISVREALREAVAAFGPGGTAVELASPATPEAVYWALERVRASVSSSFDGDDRDSVRPPVPTSAL